MREGRAFHFAFLFFHKCVSCVDTFTQIIIQSWLKIKHKTHNEEEKKRIQKRRKWENERDWDSWTKLWQWKDSFITTPWAMVLKISNWEFYVFSEANCYVGSSCRKWEFEFWNLGSVLLSHFLFFKISHHCKIISFVDYSSNIKSNQSPFNDKHIISDNINKMNSVVFRFTHRMARNTLRFNSTARFTVRKTW